MAIPIQLSGDPKDIRDFPSAAHAHRFGRWLAWLLLTALALAAPAVFAAPLDVLLMATPERGDPRVRIDLSLDKTVGSRAFSTLADPSDQAPSVTQGDYSGAQLHTAWRATDRLWLSGELWQRRIGDAADRLDYRSWQLEIGRPVASQRCGRRDARLCVATVGLGQPCVDHRVHHAGACARGDPEHRHGDAVRRPTAAGRSRRHLQMSSQLDLTALFKDGVPR